MNSYVLRPSAVRDLDEIWEYISRDDVEAANRWVEKLHAQIMLLARNPKLGHAYFSQVRKKPLRFWPYEHYVIIYYHNGEDVIVIAITQGHRSVKRLIEQRWPS